MPKKYNNILKYNHGEKSIKVQIDFYADTKSLFEKMDTCYNNPKKSSRTKININTLLLLFDCLVIIHFI